MATTQVQTSHLSCYSNCFPSVAPRAHHSPAPPLGFRSCLFLIQTLMATLVSLLFPEQAQHMATPGSPHQVPATRKPLPSQVLWSFPHFLQMKGLPLTAWVEKNTPYTFTPQPASFPSHCFTLYSILSQLNTHTERHTDVFYCVFFMAYVSLHNGLANYGAWAKSAPPTHPPPKL